MVNDDLLTVKQLADKLGIAKSRVSYQVRKVADNDIRLIDGVQYLSKQAQEQITKAINQLKIEQEQDNTHEQTAESTVNNDAIVIEVLKQRIDSLEILTETLQDQLIVKDRQIDQLHTVIATQAQKAGVKQLEHDNTDVKLSWWQRFFK